MSADDTVESKYEVREVIGKGAFGEVNLVVEKQTKQKFVLKRIKMARQSEWQRRATRQEIEIVSRLRHPFIMPYKEHWVHHGHTINVVYGYCEKGDLTSAINKQKGKFFPEEMLRLWLAELLMAVDYMHRQNVLHRDIKTQNILLTGENDVQVGDFGLSTLRFPSGNDATQQKLKQLQQYLPGGDDTETCTDLSLVRVSGGGDAAATPEPAKGHHALVMPHAPANHASAEAYINGIAIGHANGHNGNQLGDKERDQLPIHTPVHDTKGTLNDYALVGTPHFMSPELLSSQKYSFETDIWSLGVVMYELTTLKPPFNAFNLAGLVTKIKRATLPPIPSCYSTDWTAILKCMLRKDPARRATALGLLAIPSMRQALHQAWQRAVAILPNFVLPPEIAAKAGPSPAFRFDMAAPPEPSTPVLLNPQAGTSGQEAEPSPLSKFPDLGSVISPRSAETAAVGPTAVAPPPPAAAAPAARGPTIPFANSGSSQTPQTARRSGTTGGADVQRMPAPQAPSIALLRSKTPARALGAEAALKADGEPPDRRTGPSSGVVTRMVPSRTDSARRSLLSQHPAAAGLATAGAVTASVAVQAAGHGETMNRFCRASADGMPVSASVSKIPSPHANGGRKCSTSGAAPAAAAASHPVVAETGGGDGRAAPWRVSRPASMNTVRTSRTCLAAISSPPATSPRASDAPPVGRPFSAKRAVAMVRGSSNDVLAAAARQRPAAAATVAAGDCAVAGPKRLGVVAEAGHATLNTTRQRNSSNATGAAATAAFQAGGATTYRRSQPGNDAAVQRQPDKRLRRASLVSYGKPADSAPLQRRPAAVVATAAQSILTTREQAAAASRAEVHTAREACPLSSHPVGTSDAHDDSRHGSPTSGSSPENPAAPWGPAASPVVGSVPSPQGSPRRTDGGVRRFIKGHGESSGVLASMSKEDSELSLPDGRYEAALGGLHDLEKASARPNLKLAGDSPCPDDPASAPRWSCNHLFSGNYGSFSFSELGAGVGSGAPRSIGGSVQGQEGMPITVELSNELPRRVSASAFGAASNDDVSMPLGSSRGTSHPSLRRLDLDDSATNANSRGKHNAEGGGGMELVSPRRDGLRTLNARAAPHSPRSTATTSSVSSRYGDAHSASAGTTAMEIISPTAADAPSPRALVALTSPSDRSDASKSYHQLRPEKSNRSLDSHVGVPYGTPNPPRYSDDSSSTGQLSSKHKTSASMSGAGSEATSRLRYMSEDGDVTVHQKRLLHGLETARSRSHDGTTTSGGGGCVSSKFMEQSESDMTSRERQQLALLQRVISVAGSLWEMGRDEELGAVLSSTISRVLVRTVSAPAAPGAARHGFDETLRRSQKVKQPQYRLPELGDLVRVVSGPMRGVDGVVRYRGPCHWGAGTVVGLELRAQAPAAANVVLGGLRDGVRYFHCQHPGRAAIFAEVDQVAPMEK